MDITRTPIISKAVLLYRCGYDVKIGSEGQGFMPSPRFYLLIPFCSVLASPTVLQISVALVRGHSVFVSPRQGIM